MPNLLVVGARPGSIGATVATLAGRDGWNVRTAGIEGEDVALDAVQMQQCRDLMLEGWHAIVCTVGVNLPESGVSMAEWQRIGMQSMDTNYAAPMTLLGAWLEYWTYPDMDAKTNGDEWEEPPALLHTQAAGQTLHFAAISSNSAHVPRSFSAHYCASKAALSMGLRCVARQVADKPFAIYGYEPGWIADTPMSRDVLGRLGPGQNPSRTPGAKHLLKEELANMICTNLTMGQGLNGSLLRVDGGEV